MLALSPRITSRHGQLCRRIQGQHRANIRNLHTSQMIPSTFPGWNPTHSILHGSDEYQPPTNHQPGFSSHSSNMGMDRNHPMDEGLVFRILLKSINAITYDEHGKLRETQSSPENLAAWLYHTWFAPQTGPYSTSVQEAKTMQICHVFTYMKDILYVYIYINIYV